jgi:hypothetical protein
MVCSIHSFLYAEGTLETQFVLTCFWGVVWCLTLDRASKTIIQPWFGKAKWKQQLIDIQSAAMKKYYGLDMPDDDVFILACDTVTILFQHGFGGLLCLPSVLGYQGPLVWALACHGGLCEAGWELQDVFVRAYQVCFGTEQQKRLNPKPMLLGLVLHHAMGLGMVIPMNIVYGSNVYYHELVFLLQGAACVAMIAMQYGYTLDVHKRSDLLQMRACVSVSFAAMLWSRLFRYIFVGYKLLSTFYADGHMGMFWGGGLVVLLMTSIKALTIHDCSSKLIKYWRMNSTDEQVKEVATDTDTSSSQQNGSNNATLLTGKENVGVMKEDKKKC